MFDVQESFILDTESFDASTATQQDSDNTGIHWYHEALSRPLFSHWYTDKKHLSDFTSQLLQDLALDTQHHYPLQKLLLDLYLREHLTKGKGSIGLFTSNGKLTSKNSKQYRVLKAGSKIVKPVIQALADDGYIELLSGTPGHSTKIKATHKLILAMLAAGLCVTRYTCRTKWPIVHNIETDNGKTKAFIQRPLAEELGLKTLLKYNRLAAQSDISVGGAALLKYEKQGCRVFLDATGAEFGRFYGPIWQTIASEARQFITINGMGTAEHDIVSTHPLIAYALNGYDLTSLIETEGQAYELAEINTSKQSLRRIVKQALLTLFNAPDLETAVSSLKLYVNTTKSEITGKPMYRSEWAKVAHDNGYTEYEAYYWLFELLQAKHYRIADFFFSESWRRLGKVESDICVSVIGFFLARDILVLPVHDSFVCPADQAHWLAPAIQGALEHHLNMEFVNPEYLSTEKRHSGEMNTKGAQQALTTARTIRQDYKNRIQRLTMSDSV